MADPRLYMNTVNGWEKMGTAVNANDTAVSHLGFKVPELRGKGELLRGLYAEHAALAAARQTITQEMQEVIEEGDQIFRMLREALRDFYGKRNPKLVEFGIDPLPTRPRATGTTIPLPEAPAPDPAK
ncbi:MAG TPA: hypothetical protein VNW71_16835 [Thermoanaerobaculia bacterium]|nr:hypothetical protein [Thermoanaerobaculia bacterium]